MKNARNAEKAAEQKAIRAAEQKFKPLFVQTVKAYKKAGDALAVVIGNAMAAGVKRVTLCAWMVEIGYAESTARSTISRLSVSSGKRQRKAGAGRKTRKTTCEAFNAFNEFTASVKGKALPDKFWSDVAYLAGRMAAGKSLPKPKSATVPEAVAARGRSVVVTRNGNGHQPANRIAGLLKTAKH